MYYVMISYKLSHPSTSLSTYDVRIIEEESDEVEAPLKQRGDAFNNSVAYRGYARDLESACRMVAACINQPLQIFRMVRPMETDLFKIVPLGITPKTLHEFNPESLVFALRENGSVHFYPRG
jgi:hypothetical protein